jgi:hypothetical protein
MPVKIVPSNEVIVTGDTFLLKPSPGAPVFGDYVRTGIMPLLYENINPGLTITVIGGEGCPAGTIPDFITSITLVPGQNNGSGKGNSVVSVIELADGPIPDIPEFNMSAGWSEPRMSYGTIAGFAPTLALVAPLRGYYGEKYFYDAEYIYASYYRNSEEFSPLNTDTKASINNVNRLTAVSLLEGKRTLKFNDIPKDIEQITTDLFPKRGIPIELADITPSDEVAVLKYGSDYLQGLIPEISSWVKWRPSFIEVMRYYYTLVVTHTCPPFVTTFEGSMLVENNWTPAANRLSYYIDQQVGFLDEV